MKQPPRRQRKPQVNPHARKMDKLNVGDFITYKNMHMAIVAENVDKNKFYALCFENHKLATFEMDDKNAKMFFKGGCNSLVKAIYDDMDYRMRHK